MDKYTGSSLLKELIKELNKGLNEIFSPACRQLAALFGEVRVAKSCLLQVCPKVISGRRFGIGCRELVLIH
ncbi:hypothetical protein GCM10011396_04860 [Undibacterium terreum]|uniref:Uncharacterized protein n=1 Tax=Undibacterium terreum TaxID=1224302 RepID=A0A916U534_9BURK|nr:hypothetical protein GCM10011396_04860 [Undibacterium terreum]